MEIKSINERIGTIKIKVDSNIVLSEYITIVLGDWNVKLGKDREIKGVTGPYGLGEGIE